MMSKFFTLIAGSNDSAIHINESEYEQLREALIDIRSEALMDALDSLFEIYPVASPIEQVVSNVWERCCAEHGFSSSAHFDDDPSAYPYR